jgi:hypothetical protein
MDEHNRLAPDEAMAEWTPRTCLVCRDIEHTIDGIEAEFEVGGLVELLVPYLVPALAESEELVSALASALWVSPAFQDGLVAYVQSAVKDEYEVLAFYVKMINALTDDEWMPRPRRSIRPTPCW